MCEVVTNKMTQNKGIKSAMADKNGRKAEIWTLAHRVCKGEVASSVGTVLSISFSAKTLATSQLHKIF